MRLLLAAVVTLVGYFVRLFLRGSLAGEWAATLDSDFFEAAIVHVADNGAICLEDLTDGDLADDCPASSTPGAP